MTALTEQESGWINEVATRLRLIQVDIGEMEAAKRSEFLQEEVERSFKSVPPGNRKRLLQALLERFPVAGKLLHSTPPAPTSAAPAPAPPAAPESPEQTLARLLSMLPQLPEAKRATLMRQLFECDWARTHRSAPAVEISEEALKALGLPAGQQPRLERLVNLAMLLLDSVSRLDQTALKTLEVVSPRSSLLKRNESVRKSAVRYLLGEVETMEVPMRECAGLLGALLAATLGGGRIFGQQYLERFAPTAIEDVVRAEGGGGIFRQNVKERCWDRYMDLSRDFATPDLVDRKLKECLALVVQRTAEKGGFGGR